MEQNKLAALTAFLESEKKSAEHQALTLIDEIPALKKRVRDAETRFNTYRVKQVWYLLHLAYAAIRLEGAKSELRVAGENLTYYSVVQKRLSDALDTLPHGRFNDTVIALVHISTMRPIDKPNPFYDESSNLNSPRFVASYFLDELRDCRA
jgi:hypothetical protein